MLYSQDILICFSDGSTELQLLELEIVLTERIIDGNSICLTKGLYGPMYFIFIGALAKDASVAVLGIYCLCLE